MRSSVSLRSSAIALAFAGTIEFGLQMAIPIVLVRYLDPTAFGQYRFLWLLASAALAVAPAFMPQSLFYFLPRANPAQKHELIGNVLVYLIVAGCVVGVLTSGWNPLLPTLAYSLFFETYTVSAIFLVLWVVASLMDVLPTADGRAHWQSKSIIALSLLRTLLLAGAAMFSNKIMWVVFAMLIVAIAKIALLAFYLFSNEQRISWQMSGLKKQLAYSLPFAVGNALFLLRIQTDQWVVASMLSPADFATFSISAAILPLATLVRKPVQNTLAPSLNSAHANHNFAEIKRLIAKSNGVTALLLVPISGGLFATAPELIDIVYTHRYHEAAPVMQVYMIGMMMTAFAVGHVLPALEKGRFSAVNSAVSLAISVVLSIVGVTYFGLTGAALGSVFTLALGEIWSLHVVARALNMPVIELLGWHTLLPLVLGTFIATAGALMLGSVGDGGVFSTLLIKSVIYLVLLMPFFFLAGGREQLRTLIGG